MANINAPFGLIPIDAPQGSVRRIKYDMGPKDPVLLGTAYTGTVGIFIGDPICNVGCTMFVPTSADNGILGVVVGINDSNGVPVNCIPLPFPDDWLFYELIIADDPNQRFIIQEDSVGGAISYFRSTPYFGANLAFDPYPIGNKLTGKSGFMLDSSSADAITAGNPPQLQILGKYNAPDNEYNQDYCRWVVKINMHQLG